MKIGGVDILEGWNDMKTSLSTGKAVGANVPTYAPFIGGVKEYNFAAGVMEELQLEGVHVDHDYKPGSEIFFHVHWAPDDTNTGVVRWGIEYTIARGHEQMSFPASNTVYIEQAGSGISKFHQITEDTVGISLNIEPDTLILTRVFRDGAHANDTYTGIAWGLEMDLHYISDRKNTVNKEPNFYG